MPVAFPLSAIVAQEEMKLAILIAATDQSIGGVLAFGDRGTGKSTAIRALARLGVVALDEGANEEEQVPHTLIDRFAYLLDLSDIRLREALPSDIDPEQVRAARGRLSRVSIDDQAIEALCDTAIALGVDSLAAYRAARASAALGGRDAVAAEDNQDEQNDQDQSPQQEIDKPLQEQVLEAAEAAIPPNLLAMLQMGAMRQRAKSSGKSSAIQSGSLCGRPAGTRRGEPGAGVRLNIIDTLRVAAPWQRLRREERAQKSIETEVLVEVRRLAKAKGEVYLPLPHADAKALSGAVQAVF